MRQWVESWLNGASWTIGVSTAFLTEWIFGGIQYVTPLLFFMAADIIIGCLAALIGKSPKTKAGGISSTVMFIGFVKKISALILLAVAVRLDRVLNINIIGNSAAVAFCCQEVVSIIENYSTIAPVPNIFNKALEILREKEDENNGST